MPLSYDDATIVAVCTPVGAGALALVRLSGADAFTIADAMSNFATGDKPSTSNSHTIQYGSVIAQDGLKIDRVLFLLMRSPKTFTGQDTIEISCHNNPFIVDQIIREAICHGARLAQHGEFARRAVLNNKIDILQAEAINELIGANTQQALHRSLAQLDGSFSAWVHAIEKKLLQALALTQASFEFLDEEIEFSNPIATIIREVIQEIKKLDDDATNQKQIREGFRIALIGAVNVGKSSLFNLLARQQRAIVTSIAGTTRDTIEAGVYQYGSYWTYVDTAGIRDTHDVIEQEGIRRSCVQAQMADVLLFVCDGSRAITAAETALYHELKDKYAEKMLVVCNKNDLAADLGALPHGVIPTMRVSAITPDDADRLEEAICHALERLTIKSQLPFLLNQRHRNSLLTALKELEKTIALLEKKPICYELVAYQLNDTLSHLSALTGKSISEQAMDQIFRSFCIGK